MAVAAKKRPIPTGEGLTYEKVWAMFQETDQKFKEVAEQHKETKRIISKLFSPYDDLVEHLVAPNIKKKFNELGFCFTQTARDVKIENLENSINNTEVDILLENGDIVVAVEVKPKPKEKDVNDHVKRMEILRRHADDKQDKRRYQGAVAGAIITKTVRDYILKKGFYVIEQTGDTVQINIPQGFKAREW